MRSLLDRCTRFSGECDHSFVGAFIPCRPRQALSRSRLSRPLPSRALPYSPPSRRRFQGTAGRASEKPRICSKKTTTGPMLVAGRGTRSISRALRTGRWTRLRLGESGNRPCIDQITSVRNPPCSWRRRGAPALATEFPIVRHRRRRRNRGRTLARPSMALWARVRRGGGELL